MSNSAPETDFPGDCEDRRNAYHLVRTLLIDKKTNGISAEDCGPFGEEAEALLQVTRQHGVEATRDALQEMPGLGKLYDTYDPASDTIHPLADLEGMTGAELLRREFPPLKYLVEEVIPEGLSLLVGPREAHVRGVEAGPGGPFLPQRPGVQRTDDPEVFTGPKSANPV